VTSIRYGFLIDLTRCVGCNACVIACKSENNVPLGVWRIWIKAIEKGEYPNVYKSFLPLLCNNCENPSCVRVCPVKATYKRKDGIVDINPHRCIGCRYCIAACPYSARFLHPVLKIAKKCDWCLHRIENRKNPACVDACPTKAMVFGNLKNQNSEISKILKNKPVQVIKTASGNMPHVFYIDLDMAVVQTINRKEK
jgi:tetrathionate reductase subunit B